MKRGMLDPRAAEAVRALAKYGSFRIAAGATETSPASFSRWILQAEAYVGLPLFERRRTGAILTTAGQVLLRLLDEMEIAEGRFSVGVARLQETGGGRLSISAGPLATRAMLAPVIDRLLDSLPDLRIQVLVSARDIPLEALRQEKLDVAICDLTHTPDLSDLDIHMLETRHVSFWARPDHPIHTSGTISATELFREGFASPYLHKHWRATIAKLAGNDDDAVRNAERLPIIECDDYAFLIDLAARRDLIFAALPEAVAEHAALGRLRKIDIVEPIPWNICAVRRKGVAFPALDLFWQTLIDRFGA